MRIGFAGSRRLFEPGMDPRRRKALEHDLQECLQRMLSGNGAGPNRRDGSMAPAPARIPGWKEGVALEGISQIAIGADIIFTRACRSLGIPQRVFLPQPLNDYLAATSAEGERDFSDAEARASAALLGSEHIIECRVVGRSADRETRFVQVNEAIAAVSDVIMCVLACDATAVPGGTVHLLTLARERGLPTMALRVGRDGAGLRLADQID